MIKDIIELLSDDSKSLTSALLKTEVIATRLDNASLVSWVTNELEGYRNGKEIPNYRQVKAIPLCTIFHSEYQFNQNQPVPVILLSKQYAEFLIKFKLDEGIGSLELVASEKLNKYLEKPLGIDFSAILSQDLKKNSQRFSIQDVRILVSVNEIHNAVGHVRVKLLDLMLELEKKFPDVIENLKTGNLDKAYVNKSIINIMSQINITTTGTGNVITTGDNNTVTVNTSIKKNDTNALISALEQLKIGESDIREITEIVSTETPDEEKRILGTKTRGWISKMVDKTLQGSWEIGTGTAASALTELLKTYYGF